MVVCAAAVFAYASTAFASSVRGIDVEARARPEHVDDGEADHQRDRRDDFEVEQGLAADAADLLHVAGAGDAEDDGAEDDRADQHLDERDEAVAERLQLHGRRAGSRYPNIPPARMARRTQK